MCVCVSACLTHSLYLHIPARIRNGTYPASKRSVVSLLLLPFDFFYPILSITWHHTSHRQEKDIARLHHLANDENTTIIENDHREAAAPAEIAPIVTDLRIVRPLTAALAIMTIAIPHVVTPLVMHPHVVTVIVQAV